MPSGVMLTRRAEQLRGRGKKTAKFRSIRESYHHEIKNGSKSITIKVQILAGISSAKRCRLRDARANYVRIIQLPVRYKAD